MRGGTALNIFLHDMPRLSVDMDVVFVDHRTSRDAALPSAPLPRWGSSLTRFILASFSALLLATAPTNAAPGDLNDDGGSSLADYRVRGTVPRSAQTRHSQANALGLHLRGRSAFERMISFLP